MTAVRRALLANTHRLQEEAKRAQGNSGISG
jgi:hypothetical protein